MAQFIIKKFLIKKGAQKNSGPTNQSGPMLAQPASTHPPNPPTRDPPKPKVHWLELRLTKLNSVWAGLTKLDPHPTAAQPYHPSMPMYIPFPPSIPPGSVSFEAH